MYERHLGGYSAQTPGAADLVELLIPRGSTARIWAEDLSDFYPAFEASEERAATNALAMPLPVGCFAGTRA